METKSKKSASAWWIGLTYYLTAVIPSGVVAVVLAGIVTGAFETERYDAMFQIGSFVFGLLLIWPNIWYAARYIRKTYTIESLREILLWATVFYAFSTGGYFVDGVSVPDFGSPIYYFQLVLPVVGLIVFYRLSKKYLIDSV